MKRIVVVLCLAATAVAPARGGLPTPLVTTGVLASPNVALVANIPDVVSVGGRFVGPYYFTTTATGLRIYDTTDPEAPLLLGALPLPHWENEDVDVSVSRKLVLVSLDDVSSRVDAKGALYVVSWLNPRVPKLLSRFEYTGTYTYGGREVGGPGHTISCIADCARYAYVVGARDGSIQIVDLLDAENPRIAGSITAQQNPAGRPNKVFTTGTIHDVNVDPSGTTAWTVGSGGTSQLDVSDPLHPTLARAISAADNDRANHFIHHNAMRLDASTLLVTEEDYPAMCGEVDGANQGLFQTWAIDEAQAGIGALRPLDEWETELGSYLDGNAAITSACSSHWFTFNRNKVAAVAWYDQGVRFLDVSKPGDIRQVGYWIRPSSGLGASQALFVPGRDDLVYVADYNRGLDIVKLVGGGFRARTVTAPVRAEWIAAPEAAEAVRFARPHPAFGYACLLPPAATVTTAPTAASSTPA